jgi:hypothetical protein
MNKFIQILGWSFIFAICLALGLEAATNQPTQHVIDFSAGHNLKTIFDAGLRPWRLPGLENANCMLDRVNLKMIFPGKVNFSVIGNSVDMDILAKNEIYRMDIECDPGTRDAAVAQARDICGQLGISTQSLDDYLANLTKGPPVKLGWGTELDLEGVEIEVHMLLIPSMNGPAAEDSVTITWPIPDAQMKFLTAPIQPPPGYENVSMDPPPRDPNQKPFPDPNSPTMGQLLAQRGNASDTGPIASSDTPLTSASTGTTPTQKATSAPLPSQTEPKAAQTSSLTTSWLSPWYGLLAILVVILTIYVCKRK